MADINVPSVSVKQHSTHLYPVNSSGRINSISRNHFGVFCVLFYVFIENGGKYTKKCRPPVMSDLGLHCWLLSCLRQLSINELIHGMLLL